jgi:hypothetical protein
MARSIMINGNPVVGSIPGLQAFAVNLNKYEAITQSLYDSAAYVTAGQNALTFFQTPQGGGTSPISGAAKTFEDTNMLAAAMMPAMQAYLVTSIELDIQTGIGASGSLFPAAQLPAVFGAQAVAAAVNDNWKIRATGFAKLTIGSKDYITEGPLMKFPASNDFELSGAMSDISTTGASMQSRNMYGKSVGPAYTLAPNNLLLAPTQNFAGSLNWATLVTVTTQARIFFRLMGQLFRSAQ